MYKSSLVELIIMLGAPGSGKTTLHRLSLPPWRLPLMSSSLTSMNSDFGCPAIKGAMLVLTAFFNASVRVNPRACICIPMSFSSSSFLCSQLAPA
jgi:hypothetical protein